MTNEEKLAKLREVESLVIQAVRLLDEIKDDTSNDRTPRFRKDAEDCAHIYSTLFRLVEPATHHPEISLEEDTNSDYAPRGAVSCFRLRYEILCGVRKHASGWLYPKT